MLVVIAGISHRTAPVELRERLALDAAETLALAREVLDTGVACEAVGLSTCNRTELYLYCRDSLAGRQAALAALARRAGVSPQELEPSLYSYSGDGAIAHLFRVTASLDSMVVGEAQIVAQMKEAYRNAHEGGCTSVVFNRLFRHALEAGKRVRSETAIGERPVSVSSAAVELAQQVFGRFRDRTALIVGAGEMSELTAAHLKGRGVGDLMVTTRTLSSAEDLARRVGGRAVPFEDLEGHLAAADIVISSTTASHHVITREHVERALVRRRHRPIFLVDIAVPRDVDPEAARVRNAYLYDIDDLQHVVDRNRSEREREAEYAERIVTEELEKVNEWLRSLEVVPTIAVLRESVEQIRQGELERLANRIGDLTEDQRAQVEMLTTSIVNKILHVPTVRMKELAGRDECYLYVDAVRELFDLDGAAGTPAPQEPLATAPEDGGRPAGEAPREPLATAPEGGPREAPGDGPPAAPEDGLPATDGARPREAHEGGPPATVHRLRGTGTGDP